MSKTTELPTIEQPVQQAEALPAEVHVEPTPEQQAEAKKVQQRDRRFAHLTAKAADAERAKVQAVAERDAMRALLESRETDPAAPVPAQRQDITQEQIDAAADRKLAERTAAERRGTLIENGVKELGEAAWNEKTAILHDFGATANSAFMQALGELPDAHKIVAALADDVDSLDALLKKSPAGIAAQLGRMSAQMEAPSAKVKVSGAPRPVSPVGGGAVADADPDKMSMKEYAAWRAKNAPRHLGGQRKA